MKAAEFASIGFDFFAMGSPCELVLDARDKPSVTAAAAAAIAEVRRIERRYSRYRADSLLSRINRAANAGEVLCVDAETADLLDHAFAAYARSDGLFDVTTGLLRQIWHEGVERIPPREQLSTLLDRIGLDKVSWRRPMITFLVPAMELDFGGIAKEYAADRAAATLRSAGVQHGLVNLGGDIAIVGPHEDGSPWRIGVSDPRGGEAAVATLFVESGGVATSGDYERYFELEGRRYSHVVNPKTGWPVEGLPSVTVAADTCLAAGMMSTIALLKGADGADWLSAAAVHHCYVDSTGKLGGSIFD
jgi:FAD:protein FMN transferase